MLNASPECTGINAPNMHNYGIQASIGVNMHTLDNIIVHPASALGNLVGPTGLEGLRNHALLYYMQPCRPCLQLLSLDILV